MFFKEFLENELMDLSSGCSHAPTSRYDHHGDNFAIPPRHAMAGVNDSTYPVAYMSRPTDVLADLPPVLNDFGPQIVSKTRQTRPSSYHDPYSAAGHRGTSRPDSEEPPLSLVPMNNLIAHHPFPRDVQDEQVLRVFMPRLE